MITSVTADNFSSEVEMENKFVLLASLHWSQESGDQETVLECLSKKHGETIKICMLDKGFIEAYGNLEIKGHPTYMLFIKGKEIGRTLGKTDLKNLIKFFANIFLNYQETDQSFQPRGEVMTQGLIIDKGTSN